MNTKPLLAIFIICWLTIGCKPDKGGMPNPSVDKLYDFGLSVNGFSVATEVMPVNSVKKLAGVPLSTAERDTLLKKINFLYWKIGANDRVTKQTSADDGFGSITKKLANGKYHIVVVGSVNDVYNSGEDRYNFRIPGGDIFAAEFDVTVEGSALNQTIKLSRWAARIDITLENPVPADVDSLIVGDASGGWMFRSMPDKLQVYWTKYEPYTPSATFKLVPGTRNTKVTIFSAPAAISGSIFITAMRSKDESIVIEKKIQLPDNLRSNVRYILNGKFFDDPDGSGLSVKVDESWLENQNIRY